MSKFKEEEKKVLKVLTIFSHLRKRKRISKMERFGENWGSKIYFFHRSSVIFKFLLF